MKHLIVLLPAALFAPAAFAADAVFEEPPAPVAAAPVAAWSGFYAGVQAGYGFGSTGVFTMDRNQDGIFGDYLPAFDPTQPGCAGDGCGFDGDFDDGFIGGVHVGYDRQVGSVVFGGILDVNFADLGDSQSGFSGTPAFYTIEREIDYLVTARARIGYAFSDRLLAYATGGLAYGDVDSRFVSNTPATVAVVGGDDSDVGYTIGGGVETRVTSNWSVGLEYLYTNLGSNNTFVNLSGAAGSGAGNAFGTGGADSTNARGSESDFDFHTVSLKLSYRF